MFEVNVKTNVTAQQVADLMSTAFEGGSNYWVASIDYVKIPAEVVPNGIVTYSHPEFWAGDFELVVEDAEAGKEDDKIVITPETLKKGIQAFAEQYPNHFSDWMTEHDDAATADTFLQMVCFGEVIYG